VEAGADKRRTKKPIGNDWQKRPFNPNQFNGNSQNVGIQFGEVSGGLVDTDLDSKEAIGLAPEFLPATDAVFGRKSKPCSHQFYVSDLYKTEKRAAIQYAQWMKNGHGKLVQGQMIVELRIGGNVNGVIKGAATVVPPTSSRMRSASLRSLRCSARIIQGRAHVTTARSSSAVCSRAPAGTPTTSATS